MDKYIISVAASSASFRWKARRLTWEEFVKKLDTPIISNETVKEYDKLSKPEKSALKDVGGFMAGELSGPRRLKGSVISRSMLTLDIDGGDEFFTTEFEMRFPGIAAVVYGTRSDRPGARRFRLIVPFLEEVTDVAMYEAAGRKMAELLGIEAFDPTTFQPERMMYWQSLSKDQPKYFEELTGEPMDINYLLDMYKDWRDVRSWAYHTDHEREMKALISKEKAEDPRNKEGLVGAFCRTYSISGAISEFLSDIYTEAGKDRYTYVLGTSAAGLVVYEDTFCFSHHSTDPIADGHAYNAFDLVRTHKFGHLGKEQSEKEMNKLVCADKNCVKELVTPDNDLSDFDDYGEDSIDNTAEEAGELIWDLDRKGEKLCTIRNFVNAFKSDPLLNNLLANDQLKETLVFTRTPYYDKTKKKGDLLEDGDMSVIKGRIEKAHGLYNDAKITDALEQIGMENAFHPIKMYLEGLMWDGIPRVDTFLIKYMGADDNLYTREAFRKMLVAAVARVYEPGRKFDTALVMYSEQGVGKSTLIQKLAKGFFNDSLTDVSGQKAYEAIQYSWIVELAELSALRRSDVEAVKNFISKREDTYRSAYARRVKTHKRQCVFFGSTNDDEFLKDATGNRRFFPVIVRQNPNTAILFDDSQIEPIIDQLWAEAVELYMTGEELILSEEAEKLAGGTRDYFTEKNLLSGVVEQYLDTLFPSDYEDRTIDQRLDFLAGSLQEDGTVVKNTFCLLELWTEALGRKKEEYTTSKGRELANIVKGLRGWERSGQTRTKNYGTQVIYRRKGAQI